MVRWPHTILRTMTLSSPSNKYSTEDLSLIADLVKLSNKSPKLVKSTEHLTPVDPDVYLRSWKMNEYKYRDITYTVPYAC